MFRNFGLPELLILLVLVLLLFGVGRISQVAKELGSGIRAFKEGLQGKSRETPTEEDKKETHES
ncbi:MAG: twin-arginine translocase TatA/TatE family subunit [Anaerolineales bacterium]|nr:twin-arginine translocase TatA/TatE family subunit [Anaerolineales bacterium]MCX7608518.1 twin-arginine translocase TatA/TatE family subunit [Anaerolineales bacterium]MDW8227566.1 twin-arginine translocase TatA/TatE family subunit [Anaerolineales bacterium]